VLEDFLNKKPLYYDEIDYTRMPRVYEHIKSKLKIPKIIHIVGTNGKGTTGRFLATALYNIGYSVGHYTSPHILNFNERIWLNNKNISQDNLNQAHEKFIKILDEVFVNSLSYFEYTTLLAIYIYQNVDYVVLEAGLGGEYDATSVFTNILTVLTPIDIDHEVFLGSTIKDIATTKLNAIQKSVIEEKQKYYEVYDIADKISKSKNTDLFQTNSLLSDIDKQNIDLIAKRNNLVPYLIDNLSTSIAALNYLNISYKVENFDNSRLFGRLTQIKENVILDVGHNVLAAKSIVDTLKGKKFTLIYNSFKDKEYEKILKILKPIISEVEIIDIDNQRVQTYENIEKALNLLEIKHKRFFEVLDNKEYLVFGSFSVAEAFLRGLK